MDRDRRLERLAAGGDRHAQARIAERSDPAPLLLAELERIATMIHVVEERHKRLKEFSDKLGWDESRKRRLRVGPRPDMDDRDDPFSSRAALTRRWRRTYRAWLRASGKRAKVDLLLLPEPECKAPDSPCFVKFGRTDGSHLADCPRHRTAVFAGPKHSWSSNVEWSENSRLSTRARRRRGIMKAIDDRKRSEARTEVSA